MCIRKSEKMIEILHESKESSRGRSDKEEGMAGKNKLWMRKVQPTKLGPSQQHLVNILLGKWLEMCSFWTKFTSKSCPNVTHRLTLLHDFSVVVVRHPQNDMFVETVINRRVPKPVNFQFWTVNVVLQLLERDRWSCTIRSFLPTPSFRRHFSLLPPKKKV